MLTFQILRRENRNAPPHWERYPYEPHDGNETVATALTRLNEEGHGIRWECSCLQRKCGACAMVIGGKPMLACDARLSEVQRKGIIQLEPLRKFPVIADLICDRSILFENLKTLAVWLEQAHISKAPLAYEASRCLQCGCCLEVCPNFCPGEKFFGMAALVPAARLITELPPEEQQALLRDYRAHIYEGCGKSLACRNICPAGLDIDKLMVNCNAAAFWKFVIRNSQ